MTLRDIAFTVDNDAPEGLMAHRIDCIMVQWHREQDKPILTMLGIDKPIPPRIKKHHCLDNE